MIEDLQLMFSDGQAVTSSIQSDNNLDFSVPRNLGIGEELFIFLFVSTAFTGSGVSVSVDLQTDSTNAFTAPTVIRTLQNFPALTPAGTTSFHRLSLGALSGGVDYKRFVRLFYNVSGGSLTTGAFKAGIVHDIQAYRNYPANYTVK